MAAAEHRIGRVVFEVAAPDRAAADRFSDAVRAQFDAVVVPALEAGFDRIDGTDAVIRLDRIEIDLGDLDAKAPIPADFARRIIEGLAAALPAAPETERIDAAAGRDEDGDLVIFLETGELPWAEPGRALAALTAALLALDGPGLARLATRLRPALARRRAAERLVRQFPAGLVLRLLRALLPNVLAVPAAAMVGPDRPVKAADAAAPDGLVPLLAGVLRRLAGEGSPPDTGDVLAAIAALAGRAPPLAMPPPAIPAASADAPADRPSAPDEAPEAEHPDDEAAPASRPVHAAGAVLLHPFLGTFFDRLGLLGAPGRFRDHDARVRAVLLAHHLATGADEAPEPETTLFKLLCGMDLSDPLPRRVEITDTERGEADSLLRNVVSHWTRLGRTSPAGLREAFLTRPGQLQQRDGEWRLTVEQRGVDVLLDGLPWTLSRVRTPFMQTFLLVDWR